MSFSRTCPHCQARFQAPAGVSELTCPHCRKQGSVKPANQEGRKQKGSKGQEFLDPEELKQTAFPVDQLAKEKRFQEALTFSEFEKTVDYRTEEAFPAYQDQPAAPPTAPEAEPVPEELPAAH